MRQKRFEKTRNTVGMTGSQMGHKTESGGPYLNNSIRSVNNSLALACRKQRSGSTTDTGMGDS